MTYTREQNLVDDFVRCLPSSTFANCGSISISKEFDYSRGRTDVIALTSFQEVIAFEAKLEKWRNALDQAYRNTCFSNYSYVLLPEKTALLALSHKSEFIERKVGICYLCKREIVVAQEAIRTEPLQYWLFNRAKSTLSKGINNVEFCNSF